jgi:hypothetical protein
MSDRPIRRSRTAEDEADDVFAPPAVHFDLSAARVDEMARSLKVLLESQEARLLDPKLRPEHQAVVDQLDALDWGEVTLAVEQALAILKNETYPGRAIDPADDHGDVAWCEMLVRLREVPVLGSRVARRWFAHLYRLRTQDIAVSTLTEAVAAYAVAAFEYLRGRAHEVERWSLTAGLMTDFDERVGRGAVAFVRAARLLESLLPQRPTPGP